MRLHREKKTKKKKKSIKKKDSRKKKRALRSIISDESTSTASEGGSIYGGSSDSDGWVEKSSIRKSPAAEVRRQSRERVIETQQRGSCDVAKASCFSENERNDARREKSGTSLQPSKLCKLGTGDKIKHELDKLGELSTPSVAWVDGKQSRDTRTGYQGTGMASKERDLEGYIAARGDNDGTENVAGQGGVGFQAGERNLRKQDGGNDSDGSRSDGCDDGRTMCGDTVRRLERRDGSEKRSRSRSERSGSERKRSRSERTRSGSERKRSRGERKRSRSARTRSGRKGRSKNRSQSRKKTRLESRRSRSESKERWTGRRNKSRNRKMRSETSSGSSSERKRESRSRSRRRQRNKSRKRNRSESNESSSSGGRKGNGDGSVGRHSVGGKHDSGRRGGRERERQER